LLRTKRGKMAKKVEIRAFLLLFAYFHVKINNHIEEKRVFLFKLTEFSVITSVWLFPFPLPCMSLHRMNINNKKHLYLSIIFNIRKHNELANWNNII